MSKKTLEDKIIDQYIKDQEAKKEVWKDIILNDQKTHYMISSHGRVMNTRNGFILKPYFRGSDSYKYYAVDIFVNSQRCNMMVHRLVALMFIENPDPMNKIHINHIDGNKLNNHVENLEWVTPKENVHHAIRTGLMKESGEDNWHASHTNEQARAVCEMLEDPKNTPKMIAKKLGIDKRFVLSIKNENRWAHISKDYNIPKIDCRCSGYNFSSFKYSEEKAKEICELLTQGKYYDSEIAKMTGVKKSYISDLRNGRARPDLTSQYIFSPVFPKEKNEFIKSTLDYLTQGLTTEEIYFKVKHFFPDIKSYAVISCIKYVERVSYDKAA